MNTSHKILAGVTVRKYRTDDRAALRRICYETGLMGDSIDPYFGCPDLFADFWTLYYTDYEPESTFVADADGRVVGYLMGCKNTTIQQRIQKKQIMPFIRRRFLTLGYHVDARFFSFLWRQLRSTWRGELDHDESKYVADYPAHLHMNLAEAYRSGGIGSMLLSAYLDYLRTSNVRGLHLGTTSYNKIAVPFYKKWGFRIAARYPLTLYEGIIPEKVEVLFFTRKVKSLDDHPGG